MRTKGAKNWTQEELQDLRYRFMEGMSNAEIAEVYGRSSHAIACQRSIMKKINAEDIPRSFSEQTTSYESEVGLTVFSVFVALTLGVGALLALGGAL